MLNVKNVIGVRLLILHISKNTPLFGKYLVTLIGKLVALAFVHYSTFILPKLEDSSVKLLFGAILAAIIYDIWKCHRTWENRFNWQSYLLSEGYSDIMKRLLLLNTPSKILLDKYGYNLPLVVKRANAVPLLFFESMDKLFDLVCGTIAFSLIASWGDIIGIIQLVIGLGIGLNIINRPDQPVTCRNVYSKSDTDNMILENIIRDVKAYENKRCSANFRFWKKFAKAYIVLLIALIFTVLRTIDFYSLPNVIVHSYIFTQFLSLIELWVYLEIPRQRAVFDNRILEEIYEL